MEKVIAGAQTNTYYVGPITNTYFGCPVTTTYTGIVTTVNNGAVFKTITGDQTNVYTGLTTTTITGAITGSQLGDKTDVRIGVATTTTEGTKFDQQTVKIDISQTKIENQPGTGAIKTSTLVVDSAQIKTAMGAAKVNTYDETIFS